MFPESQHPPPCVIETQGCLAIALDIATELGKPIVAVAFWVGRVNRAAVPEASVDVDGDTHTGEDDVGAMPVAERSKVHAIAESSGMEEPPDGQLGLSVAASISAHRTS